MKHNDLEKLNDVLFEQLEKMNATGLSGDNLNDAIRVSANIQGLSQQIINNASLVLKAKLMVGNSLAEVQMPSMIESPQKLLADNSMEARRKPTAMIANKALNG